MAGDRDSDAGKGSPSSRLCNSQLTLSSRHESADNITAVEAPNDAVTSISAVEDSVVHEVSNVENAEPQ